MDFNKVKLLILDSDGVSVPRGTKIEQTETADKYVLKMETNKITDDLAEPINRLKHYIRIAISSGRGLIYLQNMYYKILGDGVILQAENGNLSLIDGKLYQHERYGEMYFEKISNIKREIAQLPIKGFEPKNFILTVHASQEIPEVYEIVKRYDRDNELRVMWNGEAFDIQRRGVSKGTGLRHLCRILKISGEKTIAVGDRINDVEMLAEAGIAVSTSKEIFADYYMSAKQLINHLLKRYE